MVIKDEDIDPDVNVEEGNDGFVVIDGEEEEENVIYVDDESQIPSGEKKEELEKKEEDKPSITDIIEKQGQQQAKVLQDLGSILGKSQQVPPQQQESEEAFKNRMNDLYYKNPLKGTEEWAKRYLSPIMGQLTSQNFKLKKELLATRDDTKELFKEYGDEIEKEIGALPAHMQSNPDALDTVMNNVKLRHIDDYARKLAAELVSAELEKNKQESGNVQSGSKTHISAGGVRGGTNIKRDIYKVRPTKKELDFAKNKGIDVEDVQEYFKEKGIPRNYS
jgi:hypothetical protein